MLNVADCPLIVALNTQRLLTAQATHNNSADVSYQVSQLNHLDHLSGYDRFAFQPVKYDGNGFTKREDGILLDSAPTDKGWLSL